MAKSEYEYVKGFESPDNLPPSCWIVVRIHSPDFHRFSAIHEFEKPNDENALNLMNSCATGMFDQFADIAFAYLVSDECSFVWKESTEFYQRRMSKMLSLSVSFFTSLYVMKWKEFFPLKELKYPPSFDGTVVFYTKAKIVQDYLAWKQEDCHIGNQYNTCFWMLVKSGKTEIEAKEILKETGTQEKNELLFQQFGINYNRLPSIFRKGSSIYRDRVEEVVKFDVSGNPITRKRQAVKLAHCDITGPKFWREHPYILAED